METERQAKFKKLLEEFQIESVDFFQKNILQNYVDTFNENVLLKKQVTNLQEALTAQVEEKRTIHKRVIEVEKCGLRASWNMAYAWLDQIQEAQRKWSFDNFGRQQWFEPMTGITEEVGELAHALLKRHQGIRSNEDHNANILDAIGDISIYLLALCNIEGISLSNAIRDTWNKVVSKRNWKADKEKGVTQELTQDEKLALVRRHMSCPAKACFYKQQDECEKADRIEKEAAAKRWASAKTTPLSINQGLDRLDPVGPIKFKRFQCARCLRSVFSELLRLPAPMCCDKPMVESL